MIGRLIARLLGLPAYTDEVHEATLDALTEHAEQWADLGCVCGPARHTPAGHRANCPLSGPR